MYLRTYSPYLDSFLLVIVNLRIQLELICWALYSTVDCTCHRSCLTYIPSPLLGLTVFTHKVPSHKVYNLIVYIYISKAHLNEFKALTKQLIPLDNNTQWNS